MSVKQGRVQAVEMSDYSTDENPQWRIKLGDEYMTLYAANAPDEGEVAEFEIAHSKKSGKPYIKAWRPLDHMEVKHPEPQAGAVVVREAGPAPAGFRACDKELSIMWQSTFRSIVESQRETMGPKAVMGAATQALEIVAMVDKALKRYVTGIDETKKALESDEQANAGADDELNDDIPF